ncbi:hypothetical protein PL81_36245 [Streptomyces sp. RSD-27]|nr:hypothetical protein PL81_36245 [Streptomyces sp. RSD-27]
MGDLCAFAVALTVPAGLIVFGLPSDQVIAATTATALLYSAWRQGGGGPPTQDPGAGSDSAPGHSPPSGSEAGAGQGAAPFLPSTSCPQVSQVSRTD